MDLDGTHGLAFLLFFSAFSFSFLLLLAWCSMNIVSVPASLSAADGVSEIGVRHVWCLHPI